MFLWNFLNSLATSKQQDLQELEDRLLRGVNMIRPHATECIPGTRKSILADITTKIDDRNGANTIWIRGAPGSGKSSLSLTAKSMLQHQSRLIVYFRFDRNESTTTTPTALWRCVAYGLACRLPSARTQILQRLRQNDVDLNSAMDVFTYLVEKPLSDTTTTVDDPLVIVIDALDECGGREGHLSPERQMLLKTLRQWASLPKHFKLLVTSRPEGDITRALSTISTPIDIPSGRSVTENPQAKSSIDSSNDICTFLKNRFHATRERFPSLPADWPGSKTTGDMIYRAAGIFMWATTAANFIDSGIDPIGRLRTIMEDASGSSGMESLYFLYSVVLEMAFGKIGSDGVEAELLQSVLSTMVLAKRPLDDSEYTNLPTTEPVTQVLLDGIRDGLHSVIAPGSLRFVHKSFDDFLLSGNCPPNYRINQDKSHYLLTNLCLMTMTEGLRFNICGLETSCLKNADVPDIASKVANSISSLLSYSCLFVADHLSLTLFDEHLMRQVQGMMLDKLLFWFEAMSLLNEVNRVSPSLLLILKWLHISRIDEFKDFLHDAHRFVRAFGHPIAQSAPHLYISALPFAPENSLVAKHFLPQFPWILALSAGKPSNWPSCIFTLEHHRDGIRCVAFSVDEKYFVSGSYDRTICIFDSETGNLISGPFECDAQVHSVCFDPNGCQVGAGCEDGKVICWDIETGDKHLVICTSHKYPFPDRFLCRFGGSQTIISAGKTIGLWNGESGRCEQNFEWEQEALERYTRSSISGDGCSIALVTGKSGTTIKIWKVVNGTKIQGPVDSHPQFEHPERISALSFSVDNNFAVSGSKDGTILIWDACTGDNVGPPLSTGDGEVSAVAFSPRNHLLASIFSMVMVWDATTHELLGRLEGHTLRVNEIALSRDGQKVLTVSGDRTVRMWDLSRRGGVLGTNANQTHMSNLCAVAFSPCGKKLASLDWYSIQGWDTNTGKSLFKCDTGTRHNRLVFSPDGSQVVAYDISAGSGSIEVWNANTGALVSKLKLSDDGKKFTNIHHVAFRSTDGVMVLCSNNGVVRIWSVQDGDPQIIAKLPFIVALSPDGLTAIVRDYQRNPRHYLWSTTTHQPLPLVLVEGEYGSVFYGVYSYSGRFFASRNGYDMRVWNMRTGGLAAFISLADGFHYLAFSPDDRHIAIAYNSQSRRGEISILDTCTEQPTSVRWSGHVESISTLAFSPDGKSLASGSQDRQVRVLSTSHVFGDSQLSLGNLGAGIRMEDGWVKDVGGKLFFWVPQDHRARLVWPHSVLFGDSETTTELDLSRFKYGESWMECFSRGDSVG